MQRFCIENQGIGAGRRGRAQIPRRGMREHDYSTIRRGIRGEMREERKKVSRCVRTNDKELGRLSEGPWVETQTLLSRRSRGIVSFTIVCFIHFGTKTRLTICACKLERWLMQR